MSKVQFIGPSLSSLLGVAFVVLKLTGVIAWSWLWVLAPFWIPLIISLLVILFLIVVGIILWKKGEF